MIIKFNWINLSILMVINFISTLIISEVFIATTTPSYVLPSLLISSTVFWAFVSKRFFPIF